MINLSIPKDEQELKPRITVVGVGGAGGNAVNNMIRSNLDRRASSSSATPTRRRCSQSLRRAPHPARHQRHARPRRRRRGPMSAAPPPKRRSTRSCELLDGSNMVFITAGMGGGTGTGAAPVIARAAREHGILTVGVVTKPFHFEGAHRMRLAEAGILELQKFVDTLIIIPNQNLFRIANERTTFADAFKMADDVLHSGVRGVTDLMVMPGLINLDFADIRTVMSEMGKAMMGTGEAEGDRRAIDAAEAAISNPLLEDVSMKGARGVLINITGGLDMTLFEVDEAANRIREEVDPDANIIFGSTFDEKLAGQDAHLGRRHRHRRRRRRRASSRPVVSLVSDRDRADAARRLHPADAAQTPPRRRPPPRPRSPPPRWPAPRRRAAAGRRGGRERRASASGAFIAPRAGRAGGRPRRCRSPHPAPMPRRRRDAAAAAARPRCRACSSGSPASAARVAQRRPPTARRSRAAPAARRAGTGQPRRAAQPRLAPLDPSERPAQRRKRICSTSRPSCAARRTDATAQRLCGAIAAPSTAPCPPCAIRVGFV